MELRIKGIERELKFGTGFVRKLDEIYTAEVKGIKFGAGLIMVNIQMAQMNPSALANVIRCAVKGNPKQTDVEDFVDDYADENDGLKELFEQVNAEMGKSKTIKDTLNRAKEAQQELEEEN